MVNKNKVNSRYKNIKSKKAKTQNKSKKYIRNNKRIKYKKTKTQNRNNKFKLTTNKLQSKIKQKGLVKHRVSQKGLVSQKGGATGGTVCAPNIHNKELKYDPQKKVITNKAVHTDSCLTPPALIKLVSAWNKSTPNSSYKIITKDKSQKEIYEAMIKIFKQTNSRLLPEHEWWEQPWVTKHLSLQEIAEIKEDHYAPEAPESWHQNPTEWLSTLDIESKLNQYEDKYPEFKFFGATPIDFNLKTESGTCQVNSLCNINLKTLINQKIPKKYIGVVFNMDKHDKPGSHWIALFVNIPRREINYWDSYGMEPPMEVVEIMNKIEKQGLELNMKLKKQINKKRHQYKNSECGVYSCNFIIQQLEGKTYEQVIKNIVRDDEMNARRWQYFNK